jgi:AraC-like DNA-binding protein
MLHIRNMVSQRCKMVVIEQLKKLDLSYVFVDLGTVEIEGEITDEQREQLKVNLRKSGLELINDKRNILIEKIQNVVIEMIHYDEELPRKNFSNFISEKIGYDYTYLSNVFSDVKGITLQQYIIMHRIEKVKDLLLYDDLTLTEISYQLQYSSVAHLSSQFRKVTGLTPSFYKQLKQRSRVNMENQ